MKTVTIYDCPYQVTRQGAEASFVTLNATDTGIEKLKRAAESLLRAASESNDDDLFFSVIVPEPTNELQLVGYGYTTLRLDADGKVEEVQDERYNYLEDEEYVDDRDSFYFGIGTRYKHALDDKLSIYIVRRTDTSAGVYEEEVFGIEITPSKLST